MDELKLETYNDKLEEIKFGGLQLLHRKGFYQGFANDKG